MEKNNEVVFEGLGGDWMGERSSLTSQHQVSQSFKFALAQNLSVAHCGKSKFSSPHLEGGGI